MQGSFSARLFQVRGLDIRNMDHCFEYLGFHVGEKKLNLLGLRIPLKVYTSNTNRYFFADHAKGLKNCGILFTE